ncbi:hypothetical protein POSPLADRAFT_1159297 [Postia placenta MAD-698-R-SB12]|uniref:DUF6535 domain-containing protein n=1 Tax=Postia placenta MAD-698-R-SB12 TaxID=670580 RepID=A0A1X6MJQ8_9APHY|nr:hypothetical protein POSPLADRAFT_1159297 [Postia placenta MAD-698-R-SB12]OSX56578.1 hypothetical protein POSPLADRAFT_1159297 [Postia placenta MAD-698-R-SB12]
MQHCDGIGCMYQFQVLNLAGIRFHAGALEERRALQEFSDVRKTQTQQIQKVSIRVTSAQHEEEKKAISNNGEEDEANELSEAEVGGRVLVADEQLALHTSSDRRDTGKVPTDGKLDEELVRKVRQDTLEAKREQEDPWAKCAKEVWELEKSLVEKWKDDINYLLLFQRDYGSLLFSRLQISGLFSTVLTGFIVPFYVTLAATQALISMSGHLSVVAADAGHATIANWLISISADSQSFSGPSSTTIVVATLWFTALILSLGAASIAITVSQWLHHHINGASKASRQSVRVWYFRRRGVARWKVELAIAVLPVLLQIALILFLVGLVILLWTLNSVVAKTVTALVVTLLLPTIFTVVIPALSPDCPYKSAPAWWFFKAWRCVLWCLEKLLISLYDGYHEPVIEILVRLVWNVCCRAETWRIYRDLPPLSDWRELDNFCMQTLKDDSKTKLQMLVEADSRVMDETFLSTVVRPCLQEADIKEALPAFYKILHHRAHDHDQDKEHSPRWWHSEQDHQAVSMLGHMSLDMLDKVASSNIGSEDRKEIGHILKLVDSLLDAMPRTMPAVHSRLMDMWAATNLSNKEHVHIALPLVWYYSQFNADHIDTNTVHKMIPLLPIAGRELSMTQFLRYASIAFAHAADLPPSDFAQIREVIQGALSAVAGYFSSSDMELLAQEISKARAWTYVDDVFRACVRLAEYDASLFTKDIVDALAGCAARCPLIDPCPPTTNGAQDTQPSTGIPDPDIGNGGEA